ncbi:hypothetical protein BJQ94_02705 [Cryobacterium sp. SO2]|uniref:hypothetical protein n=1 Tax=Cryobacterium sp. SO2 TaxID=1897060 RepID=UPI00223D1004|nr:hypothetical protein [Cryobacterium sp. SO2]WEO77968.1 hypothetical protein BJQ94_02705 [Cryobacterium sp. SO2]
MGLKPSESLKGTDSWHNPQVHQATGIIVAQTKETPDEAVSRLLAYAAATESTVDQVAADLLAGKITLV